MRRRLRQGAVSIVMWSCWMALGHAQRPQPTFRVTSELVVIDLVAVGRARQHDVATR